MLTPTVDDGFEFDPVLGTLLCGWCGLTAHWSATATGAVRLTGYWALAVDAERDVTVVVAEGVATGGGTVHLPHRCVAIPEATPC